MNDQRQTMSIDDGHGALRTGTIAAGLTAIALLVLALLLSPLPAAAHSSDASLIGVEVYDRTNGTTLDVYAHDGQRFVIGTPGHEYAIRIRNRSAGRIVAVTSVDGVNVVSGETASPDQSGYVIDAGGSVEIAGWRRSVERTSAFYFTDLGDSYAARTGRPANVGVIGIAVFRERAAPVVSSRADKIAATSPESRAAAQAAARPLAAQTAPSGARDERAADASANAAPAPQLGTGFGRTENNYAYRVHFDRESDTPAETVAIRYDRRENLAAMGVLPQPRYAGRTPDPFPAMRFVPEPPR